MRAVSTAHCSATCQPFRVRTVLIATAKRYGHGVHPGIGPVPASYRDPAIVRQHEHTGGFERQRAYSAQCARLLLEGGALLPGYGLGPRYFLRRTGSYIRAIVHGCTPAQ